MITDKLNALKKFYYRHKRLPSYSEMLKIFGFSSKNAVFKTITKFVDEGLLKKDNGKLSPTNKFFALPLVGIVKAGHPILAEENKEYLSLDDYLIGDPQLSFLLKVSGDSLSGIGIYDGDIVIVEKKNQANLDDVVLAQVDSEWTLKILKMDRQKRKNFLMPANPKYPPIFPKSELLIFGVVRGLVRKIVN